MGDRAFEAYFEQMRRMMERLAPESNESGTETEEESVGKGSGHDERADG